MKKLGRPTKEQTKYYPMSVNLNEESNNHLNQLSMGMCSRTGVIRCAIEFLYSSLMNEDLESDFEETINALRKEINR